jgi:hypothetical protein
MNNLVLVILAFAAVIGYLLLISKRLEKEKISKNSFYALAMLGIFTMLLLFPLASDYCGRSYADEVIRDGLNLHGHSDAEFPGVFLKLSDNLQPQAPSNSGAVLQELNDLIARQQNGRTCLRKVLIDKNFIYLYVAPAARSSEMPDVVSLRREDVKVMRLTRDPARMDRC